VRDDHGDRAQFLVHALQHAQHELAGGVVERAGGLVAQQHVRALGHGARDGHALLLAARELRREVVAPLAHLDHGERLGGVDGCVGDLGDEGDVFECGQAGDQVVELEHEAHVFAPEARELGRGRRGEIVIEVVHLARRGPVQPVKDVEQRRLAAARGAQQDDEFTRQQLQVDVARRMHQGLAHGVDLTHLEHAEDRVMALGMAGRALGAGEGFAGNGSCPFEAAHGAHLVGTDSRRLVRHSRAGHPGLGLRALKVRNLGADAGP
jgi:hypothetical protein